MSRAALLFLVALALAACRLDVSLSVSLASDGSGTLRVDAVADEELIEKATLFGGGDPIADFRTLDLEAAGWVVTRAPEHRRLVLERRFRTVEELTLLLASLDPGAAEPVLSGFKAERRRGLFSDTYSISGRVDLKGGGSAEPLSELMQGLDPALVNSVAGADLKSSFRLTLRAELPGSVIGTDAQGRTDGVLTWNVEPGQNVGVSASSRRLNVLAIVTSAGVVVLLGVVLVLSIGVAVAARRRTREG